MFWERASVGNVSLYTIQKAFCTKDQRHSLVYKFPRLRSAYIAHPTQRITVSVVLCFGRVRRVMQLRLHNVPIDSLPPFFQEPLLPSNAPVPQPDMLPRIDPQQYVDIGSAVRNLVLPAQERSATERAGGHHGVVVHLLLPIMGAR